MHSNLDSGIVHRDINKRLHFPHLFLSLTNKILKYILFCLSWTKYELSIWRAYVSVHYGHFVNKLPLCPGWENGLIYLRFNGICISKMFTSIVFHKVIRPLSVYNRSHRIFDIHDYMMKIISMDILVSLSLDTWAISLLTLNRGRFHHFDYSPCWKKFNGVGYRCGVLTRLGLGKLSQFQTVLPARAQRTNLVNVLGTCIWMGLQ